MKKNIMRSLLLLLLACTCISCVKIMEDEMEERIHRPNSDVDIPVNPPWDTIPPTDTPPLGN